MTVGPDPSPLRLPGEGKGQHYIAHWLEIMKGDKKAIFTAAAAANRAAEYLYGLQPKQD